MRAGYWWIDRWRKSTAYSDMTLAQQGAYRNLLDELWLRDGLLPDDERILGKIAGDATEWVSVRDVVMARFIKTADGWRNETHDEVAEASDRYVESQRAKGRKRADQAKRTGGRFTSPPAGAPAEHPAAHQPSIQPEHQPLHQPPGPGPGTEQKREDASAGEAFSLGDATVAKPPAALVDPLVIAIRAFPIPAWKQDHRLTATWSETQRKAFPAVDLLAEVGKAASWWTSNPARSRGRTAVSRFLSAWFGRAAERPSTFATSTPHGPPPNLNASDLPAPILRDGS